MKLHILSDLHTEFADFAPSTTDADVVVLAGDIGVGTGGIEWAAQRFPEVAVIYVPGNHEFYGTMSAIPIDYWRPCQPTYGS